MMAGIKDLETGNTSTAKDLGRKGFAGIRGQRRAIDLVQTVQTVHNIPEDLKKNDEFMLDLLAIAEMEDAQSFAENLENNNVINKKGQLTPMDEGKEKSLASIMSGDFSLTEEQWASIISIAENFYFFSTHS